MFSSVYLAPLIALTANVHSARGAPCNQGPNSLLETYNISSQADFDAITPCELAISNGATDGETVHNLGPPGINGHLNIESTFTGGLDLRNISVVMGAVHAADNANMLAIEGQNLKTIGLGNLDYNGLVLQNLSSFNYLSLPILNLTASVSLLSLPQLRNLSSITFPNYDYYVAYEENNEQTHYMSLTINDTGISVIEDMGVSSMDAISITNNLDLQMVDLGSVYTLQGNLTFFNNGPSFSLNMTNVAQTNAIQLSNVDSVDISGLQKILLATQITNNTFTSINTSYLESFGTAGLQVSDNENLQSLDMGYVSDNMFSTTSVLQIYDNPQLVLTDSSFSSLETIGNITIDSTISGGNIFPNLVLSSPSSIHITSINTPQSNTTFTCIYLDKFAINAWESSPPYSKVSKTIYSCASYASATSIEDIATHYTIPKGHSHLSRGADVGIAIAVVCACALLTALCFVRRRKRLTPKPVDGDGDELPGYVRHIEQPPAYWGADGAAGYLAGTTRLVPVGEPVPPYEEAGGSGCHVRDVGEGDGGVEHGSSLEHGDESVFDGAASTGNAESDSYRVSEESDRDRRGSVRGDGRVSIEDAENGHHAVSGG